jgi:hypothetical protein
MAAIEVNRQIEIDDAQKALADALGPGYQVSVGSSASLKVKRNLLAFATVHLSWSGSATSFRISPGGLIVLAGFNYLYIVPKIREAIGKAFPSAT